MKYNAILLGLVLTTACRQQDPVNSTLANGTHDVHSFAEPEKAVIRHLRLDLAADFNLKVLSGTATYDISVNESTEHILFDTRKLEIRQVHVDDQVVPFTFGPEKDWLGRALIVPVTAASKKVSITYSTHAEADALQWLEPSQTAGKKHPYLFTQGQAILTRTWIPIQDSPGIRFTYDATIRVPQELMAVMSASNPQAKTADGLYAFSMTQPVPAYLIALAAGDIGFRSIGPRTGVYAEPSVLAKAAAEFEDMEAMVTTAESLYGPYRWERYDVIVLPPSFPFGGMENPRLTFATPTIIAGDKSLISLIAHELAHSWSGNLVTNATWNDFWLNEGFTVYFESRIMEALYGKSYSEMLSSLGYQDLVATVSDLDPKDTHLYLDLRDRDPDAGMTDIAYEKGAHFLKMLEQLAGRAAFDAFLRTYFDTHSFQSMTTEKFLQYLDEQLLKPAGLKTNIDEWVYGPGLPANCPVTVSERFTAVDGSTRRFIEGAAASQLATGDWTTQEWLHFIRALPDSLSGGQMKELDSTFGFTASGNSEIQAAWYGLAIRQGYGKDILFSIRNFLVDTGRRKFLTPLYTALINAGMKDEAQQIFLEARPNYHSVAFHTIEGLF